MAACPSSNLTPIVGRYALHGEIASGGMATIHFGRLQGAAGFSRSVAIKRLHPQFAKDPDFVAMFVDEARLAARIAHPNVVPTLDVVSQNDELLLVMEYVRGTSLSRLLRTLNQKGERTPARIAASIIAGMLRGLHAAHEAKSEGGQPLQMVHRDVSPQNVLVGTDGVARVLDFGVAKATGRWQSTQQGQLKGKIAYMAVEQITTGNVTRRTDVYAAAVVLWETLTGKRLFRAENEANLLGLVLKGQVQPPSEVAIEVPTKFDAIVLRGLDRDAAKRFATAREMAAAVESVVGTATPSEVGEWVERVAADELRERANRIEEIERIASSAANRLARPAREPLKVVPPLPRAAIAGREAPSHVPSLAVAKTISPSLQLGARRVTVAAAMLALFCAIGLTALAFRMPHGGPEPSVAATNHSSTPGSTAPTVTSTSAWVPIPTSTAAQTSTLDLPTPTPGMPASRPGRSAVTAKARNGAPRPDCNPPYTMDGKGHVHFLPACVN